MYDYDLQQVGLGVDIHAKGHASIKEFKSDTDWKTSDFNQIDMHWKKNLRSNNLNQNWQFRSTADKAIEEKISNSTG